MPPGGAHLAAGVCALRCGNAFAARLGRPCTRAVSHVAPTLARHQQTKALALGFMVGCVLPDGDLLAAAAYALLIKADRSCADLHRTFSHSLLITPLATALCLYALRESTARFPQTVLDLSRWFGWSDPKAGTRASISHVEAARQYLSLFALALGAGCVYHSLLDLFYVSKLQLFWPLPARVGFPVLFPAETLTLREQKCLLLADSACDALLWYIPMSFFCKSRRVHADHLGSLVLVSGIYAAELAFFSQAAWLSDTVTIEEFAFFAYFPCTLLLAASFVSPVWLGDAVHLIATEDRPFLRCFAGAVGRLVAASASALTDESKAGWGGGLLAVAHK